MLSALLDFISTLAVSPSDEEVIPHHGLLGSSEEYGDQSAACCVLQWPLMANGSTNSVTRQNAPIACMTPSKLRSTCSMLVSTGLLKRYMLHHFAHLKHGFLHQDKGTPPFTRQCSGV